MLDLLAARHPGGDDLGAGGRGGHGGRETPASEGDRDVVVLLLEAEGARHPAAAGIHLADLVPRPLERGHGGRRAHERLLVAMAVEERRSRPALEGKRETPRALAEEELFQEKAGPGHLPRLLGAYQLHPLI